MRACALATSLVLGAALSSLSCSSSGSARAGRVTANQNELTVEQIRASGATNALEAVERLRPLWIKTRSQSSINTQSAVLVYVDNTRLGGIDALRGYPLEAITRITYLTASEAANKLLGIGNTVIDGAIVVSTRR